MKGNNPHRINVDPNDKENAKMAAEMLAQIKQSSSREANDAVDSWETHKKDNHKSMK